jgi:hypothetical protein
MAAPDMELVVQEEFVLVMITGVWVFLTSLEIALREFAHMTLPGWTLLIKPDLITNMLNVLTGEFATVTQANATASLVMRAAVASELPAPTIALDTEDARTFRICHTCQPLRSTSLGISWSRTQ